MEFCFFFCFEFMFSLFLWFFGVFICVYFLFVGFIVGRSEVFIFKLLIDFLCFFLFNFDDIRYRLGVLLLIYVDCGVNLFILFMEVFLLVVIFKVVLF